MTTVHWYDKQTSEDTDELVVDGEKKINRIDNIILARWAAVVVEMVESTVNYKDAQQKINHYNVFDKVMYDV